ncbi:MAG: DUF2177 family protein [Burkholderiaceae bacterium]
MQKLLVTYLTTTVVMVLIDLVWLGFIAKPMYQAGIGHLMAEKPNIAAAISFYALFPVGLMIFAILPESANAGWQRTALLGALFGFFTYATYDLTNLATLKNYPLQLALIDILWGSLVSAVAATAGKLVFNRI